MDFINEEKTEIKNTLFIKTKGRIIATHSLLEQYSMFKSTAFFFLNLSPFLYMTTYIDNKG